VQQRPSGYRGGCCAWCSGYEVFRGLSVVPWVCPGCGSTSRCRCVWGWARRRTTGRGAWWHWSSRFYLADVYVPDAGEGLKRLARPPPHPAPPIVPPPMQSPSSPVPSLLPWVPHLKRLWCCAWCSSRMTGEGVGPSLRLPQKYASRGHSAWWCCPCPGCPLWMAVSTPTASTDPLRLIYACPVSPDAVTTAPDFRERLYQQSSCDISEEDLTCAHAVLGAASGAGTWTPVVILCQTWAYGEKSTSSIAVIRYDTIPRCHGV